RAVGPAPWRRAVRATVLPDAGPVRADRGGRRRAEPDPEPGGVAPPLVRDDLEAARSRSGEPNADVDVRRKQLALGELARGIGQMAPATRGDENRDLERNRDRLGCGGV